MTVGERIKKARKQLGMTQKELAEKAGTAIGTIQQYELGKRQPRLLQLERVADALGVHVSELLMTFTPEMEDILTLAEDNAEKFFGLDRAEVHESIMDGIRQIRLPTAQERINRFLNRLNPEGQEKAVERVEELTEIPRYRAETTTQSTPVPQEKDTTSAADIPETPPESE